VRITGFTSSDVRFATSATLAGSDATNHAPDYSAAYVTLHTDDGPDGHGFTFTIGRGNELCVAAIDLLAARLVGRPLEDPATDVARLPRLVTADSQLRWLGPEKGVVHLATAAVVNAVWDLAARRVGKPLWKFLVDLSPGRLVDTIDFRYLTDMIDRDAAVELLDARRPGAAAREAHLRANGHPAYTTEPGWLGYPDDKMVRLLGEAVDRGFTQVKLKVGGDLADDRRRLALARTVVGPNVGIAVDANQAWDVDQAIRWIASLAEFDLAWVEEPTSPDDVLGHATIAAAVAPVPIATGEMAQNRVTFKQLLAAGGMGICQIDACRVGGVNENLAILLLAAQAGIPVIPHAGGCGLSEVVHRLALFDNVALGQTVGTDGRLIEWADHLHEHFVEPARIEGGCYVAPTAPGSGGEMTTAALETYRHRP
jgi:L-fuconate dehydratase